MAFFKDSKPIFFMHFLTNLIKPKDILMMS